MIRAIQEAAISRESSITDLLRRCKILAARLGSQDFADWVELELNGYPEDTELPPYRTGLVESKGNFVGGFGRQLKNGPIPPSSIPEQFRDRIATTQMREPIGSYEDLLSTAGEGGTFQSPWPADLIALCGTEIYRMMSCIGAWQVIPRGLVVSLIDSVRNRVLSFALEIERIAPEAGSQAGTGAIASETVTQIFHTHVYGNVGNIASGSRGFSQAATIQQGDREGLLAELRRIGFGEDDLNELILALEAEDAKKQGLGGLVGQWIGKAVAKASEGALKVSTETAIKLLPKLIQAHLGLPDSE